MNIDGQEYDFNELVSVCAGPDRKDQECYLARVVMKIMIDLYGKDPKQPLPDANVLLKHSLGDLLKNRDHAMKVLDIIYEVLSKSLLDNGDCYSNDLRAKVEEYMVSDIKRREETRQEAGV